MRKSDTFRLGQYVAIPGEATIELNTEMVDEWVKATLKDASKSDIQSILSSIEYGELSNEMKQELFWWAEDKDNEHLIEALPDKPYGFDEGDTFFDEDTVDEDDVSAYIKRSLMRGLKQAKTNVIQLKGVAV